MPEFLKDYNRQCITTLLLSLALVTDLLLMFIYTVARYGDATLLVHLAYVRHLVPAPIKSGTTIYFLGLYETAIQVCSRIAKVPGNLTKSTVSSHNLPDLMNKLTIYEYSYNKLCIVMLEIYLCELLLMSL